MKRKRKNEVAVSIVSDYYNVAEAAAYMKVTKKTLYQMVYKKQSTKIPARHQGRKLIFLIDELKQWMLKRTTA